MYYYSRIYLIAIILTFLFTYCDKTESPDNTLDPSNLSVSIISVDDTTGLVIIQATAERTVEYKLYTGNSGQAADSNATGYFEYTFAGGPGVYEFTIRAYGENGKYIKETREVPIAVVEELPVPLDSGYFSPLTYDGYTLVWQDEFNGTSVNEDYWTFESGAGGWGNNELQYYRRENASVGENVLTIEAREEAYSGSEYTSARMVTKNKKSFKYGRVDIRALLPEGQGIWPALWTLGSDIGSVGWPACGEMDIMEMIGGQGREKTVYSTMHWEDNGHASYGLSYTTNGKNFHEKYHVFSIIWDENQIRSFVDNQQYFVIDITPATLSEFHKEHFFIFNIAVGGNWPGYPNASTEFPQQLKVDYIRVFQK